MGAILVKVVDRKITVKTDETVPKAGEKMAEEWNKVVKNFPDNADCGINVMDAWAVDPVTGTTYDWKIVWD